jgi:hypothetical protein
VPFGALLISSATCPPRRFPIWSECLWISRLPNRRSLCSHNSVTYEKKKKRLKKVNLQGRFSRMNNFPLRESKKQIPFFLSSRARIFILFYTRVRMHPSILKNKDLFSLFGQQPLSVPLWFFCRDSPECLQQLGGFSLLSNGVTPARDFLFLHTHTHTHMELQLCSL